MTGEQLFQDGEYIVTYMIDCPTYHDVDDGPCVVLRTLSEHVDHWHLGRFWFRRPRTIAQCIMPAMHRIQELRRAAAQEHIELADARAFAQQLITDGLLTR